MTLDRSGPPPPAQGAAVRAPATQSPARSTPGAIDPARDIDLAIDEPWCGPSIADAITLSPSATRRLAETARTRAFVMPEVDESRCTVDAGDGKSIVLDGGLYRIGPRR